MTKDLKAAVMRNISEIEKTLAKKSTEVAHLKQDLQNYKGVLTLLGQRGRGGEVTPGNGRKSARTDLRSVLQNLPDTFTSSDFVKAAAGKRKAPAYLRQTLVRWAAQGRLKRMERGKYHKTK
jgi:hypothetical protein